MAKSPTQSESPETENPALTETPEFKAALAAAVADAVKDQKDQLDGVITDLRHMVATVQTPAAGPQDASTEQLFRGLALAIAEIADQGTNRKRVAPEILAGREMARQKMGELIMEARKLPKDRQPRYRLVAKVYIKEQVVDPYQRNHDKRMVPTEIVFTGAPNEAMRPLNQSAKDIYAQFVASIGGVAAVRSAPPAWMTDQGLVIMGAGPASAGARGLAKGPVDLDPDSIPDVGNGGTADSDDFEVLDQDDPRLPEIRVLGTVAAPARRTAPGERIPA